jgi:hypothetical protein
VEPELAPVPLRLGRSAPPGEGGELLRLHVPQEPSRSSVLREKIPRGSIPACGSPQGRKRRGVILWHGERLLARDEQPDIFKRRLLVLIQVEAEPASGEAPVTVRLLPCHQRCQLERLGNRHAADFSRGHLCEDEVAALKRPPEDRPRVALRGRGCSSPGPRQQGESNDRKAPTFWSRLSRCYRPPSEGPSRPTCSLSAAP